MIITTLIHTMETLFVQSGPENLTRGTRVGDKNHRGLYSPSQTQTLVVSTPRLNSLLKVLFLFSPYALGLATGNQSSHGAPPRSRHYSLRRRGILLRPTSPPAFVVGTGI